MLFPNELREALVDKVLGMKILAGSNSHGFHLPTFFVCFLHLSLQYFTSSQTFSHFFRQVKGRPQAWQVLVGKKGFLCAMQLYNGSLGFWLFPGAMGPKK